MDLAAAGIHFEIDPLRLEAEWRDHPQAVYNAASDAALRRRDFDRANEDLSLITARIQSEIRKNPAANLGEGVKVTEDAISNCMKSDIEYMAACRKVTDARYAMNMADAAVTALEHKKRALTKLVDLWLHEYYSDPGRLGKSADTALERRRRVIEEDEANEILKEDADA